VPTILSVEAPRQSLNGGLPNLSVLGLKDVAGVAALFSFRHFAARWRTAADETRRRPSHSFSY
jgi:hypothetical protein